MEPCGFVTQYWFVEALKSVVWIIGGGTFDPVRSEVVLREALTSWCFTVLFCWFVPRYRTGVMNNPLPVICFISLSVFWTMIDSFDHLIFSIEFINIQIKRDGKEMCKAFHSLSYTTINLNWLFNLEIIFELILQSIRWLSWMCLWIIKTIDQYWLEEERKEALFALIWHAEIILPLTNRIWNAGRAEDLTTLR